MMTSQRHHIKKKKSDTNHYAWKRKSVVLHFTGMKLTDSPMKIHQKFESVYGISSWSHDRVCQWIQCFQSSNKDLGDKQQSRAPKPAMKENAIELVRYAIADDPLYLSSRNHWHLYPLKWYSSPSYPQRTWYERCMCKVDTPLMDRGTKNGQRCPLNRCLPCLHHKSPNSRLMMQQEMKLS